MINITLPDGSIKQVESGTSAMDVAMGISEGLARDVLSANVNGGGLSGQAGAIRLGIARCLEQINLDYRSPLKNAGMLTRDSREVERKKYGQPGARKKFQFSKR